MINKDNFLVKQDDSKEFQKYVKPYLKKQYPNQWNYLSTNSYYGIVGGDAKCQSDGDFVRVNQNIILSVDEFRKIILGENIEPTYEIY